MQSTPPKLGRPPGSTSDATRRRIVDAACECFGEKGYESTTTRDIGERAGVTGAAIYQYFDSKLTLFVESFRAAHRDVTSYLRAAIADADTARAALRGLILAYAETWRKFPTASVFLSCVPEEVRRHPELASTLAAEPNTVLAIIMEIVDRGIERGEVDPAAASSLTSMFLSLTLGLAQQGALAGEPAVRDAAAGFASLLDGHVFVDTRRAPLPR